MAVSAAHPRERGRAAPAPARPEAIARILVPLDGSPLALAALGPAAQLARDLGADVVLMTAAAPARGPGLEADLALRLGETDAAVWLSETAEDPVLEGLPVSPLVVGGLAGAPAQAVLAAVRDAGAGLVVMATHGRSGVPRAILGSVADAVVARSPVPVLLIRGAATVEPMDGVPEEYAEATYRMLGDEGGRAWLAQIEAIDFTAWARVAITPEWVGILDFERRFPNGLERAVEAARRRGAGAPVGQ
jgi:nucleotide-binding universal stress UspA family protein